MLDYDLLTPSQLNTADEMFERDHVHIIASMGSGKTVCALTAIDDMIFQQIGERYLVFAPLKVCQTVWPAEARGWSHLGGLNVVHATGTPKQRKAIIEDVSNNVVCVNFENIPWLVKEFPELHKMFDGYVIDEVTKLKTVGGTSFKKFRKFVRYFKWRVTMSGTPVSENWTSLYAIMFLTDAGKALGRNKEKHLKKYFMATDFQRRNWVLQPTMDVALVRDIAHLIYVMPDYRAELPPLREEKYWVEFDEDARERYREIAEEGILTLKEADEDGEGGEEVGAQNAGVVVGKLQQLSQGFIYDDNKKVIRFNKDKICTLSAVMSEHIPSGENVLIAYYFEADLDELLILYPSAVVLNTAENIEAFKRGEVAIGLINPKSASHGLNLHTGAHHLIFYTLIWSNDAHKQTIARLWRRGQPHAVTVHYILTYGSVDEVIIERLADKDKFHELLLTHLKNATK